MEIFMELGSSGAATTVDHLLQTHIMASTEI